VPRFLSTRLVLACGDRFLLSPQNPVEISDFSEPQPDLALLAARADGTTPRASEVMLVIEVADSTVRWDRDVKIAMYGGYAIAEAWLVELPGRTVTVFRDPYTLSSVDADHARRGQPALPAGASTRNRRDFGPA
jgi:hypothetical protein